VPDHGVLIIAPIRSGYQPSLEAGSAPMRVRLGNSGEQSWVQVSTHHAFKGTSLCGWMAVRNFFRRIVISASMARCTSGGAQPAK
jgi:hypothetical protein